MHSLCFHGRPQVFWALVLESGPPEDGCLPGVSIVHVLVSGWASRQEGPSTSSWAALESQGQPASLAVELLVPARVEDWETGMDKRVDSVHKLQEAFWVQNASRPGNHSKRKLPSMLETIGVGPRSLKTWS